MKPKNDPEACLDSHGRQNHPPASTLSDVWCRECGVYKTDGIVRTNEGHTSLFEILNRIKDEQGRPMVSRIMTMVDIQRMTKDAPKATHLDRFQVAHDALGERVLDVACPYCGALKDAPCGMN
jgi:hypothetical protein